MWLPTVPAVSLFFFFSATVQAQYKKKEGKADFAVDKATKL